VSCVMCQVQVSGAGEVLGVRCQAFRCHVSGVRCRCQVSDVSGVRCQVLGAGVRCTLHLGDT
jgi:hypothetical protein